MAAASIGVSRQVVQPFPDLRLPVGKKRKTDSRHRPDRYWSAEQLPGT